MCRAFGVACEVRRVPPAHPESFPGLPARIPLLEAAPARPSLGSVSKLTDNLRVKTAGQVFEVSSAITSRTEPQRKESSWDSVSTGTSTVSGHRPLGA